MIQHIACSHLLTLREPRDEPDNVFVSFCATCCYLRYPFQSPNPYIVEIFEIRNCQSLPADALPPNHNKAVSSHTIDEKNKIKYFLIHMYSVGSVSRLSKQIKVLKCALGWRKMKFDIEGEKLNTKYCSKSCIKFPPHLFC